MWHWRSCRFITWSHKQTNNHLDSYKKNNPDWLLTVKKIHILAKIDNEKLMNKILTLRQTFYSMFWISCVYFSLSVDTLRWTGDADVVLAWNEFDTSGLIRSNVTTSAIPDTVAPLWPHPGFIAASEDGMLAESSCASHTKQPGGIETEWSRPQQEVRTCTMQGFPWSCWRLGPFHCWSLQPCREDSLCIIGD